MQICRKYAFKNSREVKIRDALVGEVRRCKDTYKGTGAYLDCDRLRRLVDLRATNEHVEWLQELRYRWRNEQLHVHFINSSIPYNYEFLSVEGISLSSTYLSNIYR